MTPQTPGHAARDLQAEQAHAEFIGWMEAQGNPTVDVYDLAEYGQDDMAEAFAAGMEAARMLAAQEPHAAPDYILRRRIEDFARGLDRLTEQGSRTRMAAVKSNIAKVLREMLADTAGGQPAPVCPRSFTPVTTDSQPHTDTCDLPEGHAGNHRCPGCGVSWTLLSERRQS